MTAVELFNKNLFKFLDNLSIIISIDYYTKLIEKKKNNMQKILYIKNDILIDLYNKNIYTYKDNILKEDVNILSKINKLELFDGLDITTILQNMNDENKTIFWNYLKVFTLLCEKHYYTL